MKSELELWVKLWPVHDDKWQMLQAIILAVARTTFLAVVIIDLGHLDGGAKAIIQNAKQPNNKANYVGRIKGDFRIVGRWCNCGGGIAQILHLSKHARITGFLCKFITINIQIVQFTYL